MWRFKDAQRGKDAEARIRGKIGDAEQGEDTEQGKDMEQGKNTEEGKEIEEVVSRSMTRARVVIRGKIWWLGSARAHPTSCCFYPIAGAGGQRVHKRMGPCGSVPHLLRILFKMLLAQ